MILDFNDYIVEKYGYNELSKILSNFIYDKINDNFGKLILNNKLTINKIDDINFNFNSEELTLKFIDPIINIEIDNPYYGNINISNLQISTYSDKDYIVDFQMNLKIHITNLEKQYKGLLDNKINETIVHECTHFIEHYFTIKKENKIATSWERGKTLYMLQKQYKGNINWDDISHFIYLSLPHEIRARIGQLNKDVENINKTSDALKYIKTTKIYNDLVFLSKMDSNILLNKLKLDQDYNDIIKDFSELFLRNVKSDYEKNFIKYIDNIKTKCDKMIKKVEKISYNAKIMENYIDNNFNEDRNIDYNEYIK